MLLKRLDYRFFRCFKVDKAIKSYKLPMDSKLWCNLRVRQFRHGLKWFFVEGYINIKVIFLVGCIPRSRWITTDTSVTTLCCRRRSNSTDCPAASFFPATSDSNAWWPNTVVPTCAGKHTTLRIIVAVSHLLYRCTRFKTGLSFNRLKVCLMVHKLFSFQMARQLHFKQVVMVLVNKWAYIFYNKKACSL